MCMRVIIFCLFFLCCPGSKATTWKKWVNCNTNKHNPKQSRGKDLTLSPQDILILMLWRQWASFYEVCGAREEFVFLLCKPAKFNVNIFNQKVVETTIISLHMDWMQTFRKKSLFLNKATHYFQLNYNVWIWQKLERLEWELLYKHAFAYILTLQLFHSHDYLFTREYTRWVLLWLANAFDVF